MGKTSYQHIKYFKDYKKRLMDNGANFELVTTTYTRIFKFKNSQVIFNGNGTNDDRFMSVMGSVRKEGQLYLAEESFKPETSAIKFFDLFEKPRLDGVISKVDVKAAYWNYALKKTIISEETNQKLLTLYDGEPVEVMKHTRVRSLGSLATARRHELYVGGKLFQDISNPDHPDNPKVITQPTKDLYIDICRGIDDLMRDCVVNVDGCVYYYWDCMFVPKHIERKVIDFFKDHKYNVSVNHTRLDYYTIGDKGWLVSTSDNKQYMVRREDSHLLKDNGLL